MDLKTALDLHRAGRLAEAETAYRQVLADRPSDAVACHWLGMLLHARGRAAEADELLNHSIQLAGDRPDFHNNIARLRFDAGRYDLALAHLRASVRLRPDHAQTHYNLGAAFERIGKFSDALPSYDRAIAIDPRYPEAHTSRGNTLWKLGRAEDSIAAHRRAIELRPGFAEAYNNLALPLADQGRLDDVLECYQKLVSLRPDHPPYHSNLLLTMQFDPRFSRQQLFDEAKHWSQRHAEALAPREPEYHNDLTSDRPLRIGYVSADFRDHPVNRFFEPLLAAHDRGGFETYCYAAVKDPDGATARLRSIACHWRDVARMSDEDAAALVRRDRIDILVDLAGHMGSNRLLLFARRPAPIQASYLGYPATTGMTAIQYRITDEPADPPASEQFYSERLVRLPTCAWCYRPSDGSPGVAPLPAVNRGYVTFAALNRPLKVTPRMIELWKQILRAVPRSRLLVSAGALDRADDSVRQRLLGHGIDASRFEVVVGTAHDLYLQYYNRADIALDTFPYHGTTTTCDALWMGVPVVTLAGDAHVSRTGVSLLAAVGLPELAAPDEARYVQIAAGLAGDLESLGELRSELRPRMARSPLTDGPRLARAMENAFRQMWRAARDGRTGEQ